jgi:hypothetical protein
MTALISLAALAGPALLPTMLTTRLARTVIRRPRDLANQLATHRTINWVVDHNHVRCRCVDPRK